MSTPPRIFFATGEPSGEYVAVLLGEAIRKFEPDAQFMGFGDRRMENAGFTLWERTTGWATLGPLAAIPQIPRFYRVLRRTLARIAANPPDVIVLVDYGAFNLRLARILHQRGYTRPVVYAFPPSAWRDRPQIAQDVAKLCTPLIPFERQAKLYASLGLAHVAKGHPLAGVLKPVPPRPPASADGGCVALLPGSRKQELAWNLPAMVEALHILRSSRPQLEGVLIAANPQFVPYLEKAVAAYPWLRVELAAEDRWANVDVALIKSGTSVLEAALRNVPTVAMYVVSPALAWIIRKVFKYDGGFITLPNLVLEREIIRERLQESALPESIAADLDALLREPGKQLADFAELRERLGGDDVLDEWARTILQTVNPL